MAFSPEVLLFFFLGVLSLSGSPFNLYSIGASWFTIKCHSFAKLLTGPLFFSLRFPRLAWEPIFLFKPHFPRSRFGKELFFPILTLLTLFPHSVKSPFRVEDGFPTALLLIDYDGSLLLSRRYLYRNHS